MKRSQSVAAALSVACIAAGVVDSSAAAQRLPLPLGLDLGLDAELRALGLDPLQVLQVTSDVASFLGKSRAEQTSALRAQGIVDPGGDLRTDGLAADFVLGQYLVNKGINTAAGIQLQIGSGKLSPRAALDLAQRLKPSDISVSATEVEQQLTAAKGREDLALDEQAAFLRGRLQRAATMLRGPLNKLLPNLAEVWVDDKGGDLRLVVSVAGGAEDVIRVLGRASFAGIAIDVRAVKYSATTVSNLGQAVRDELARELPGAKVLVSADTVNSVVRVQPHDAEADKRVKGNARVRERVNKGDVVVDPPRASAASAVVGGHNTEFGGCTWGFAAATGSNKMLVTAGHCVTPGTGGYSMWIPDTYHQAERMYGAVDAERQTTDPYFYDQFDNFVERQGLSNLEITGKKKWEDVGYSDVACHQGRTSGHSCGYVTNRFVAPPTIPSSWFFVRVESPTMVDQPGDSGGPWFYGNNAYGIHHGGCWCYGNWDVWGYGIYGAIDFAENQVGFSVMTK